MYELKKNGKVFTSKFVGTGPSSYKKRIYRAAVSQKLRNADIEGNDCFVRVTAVQSFNSDVEKTPVQEHSLLQV